MERTQLLLRIDSALHKRIFNAAKAEEKSVNELATEALKSYLDELEVKGDELQKLIENFPNKAEIQAMLDGIAEKLITELSRSLPAAVTLPPAPPTTPAPTAQSKFDWAGFWASHPGIARAEAEEKIRQICPTMPKGTLQKGLARHFNKQ